MDPRELDGKPYRLCSLPWRLCHLLVLLRQRRFCPAGRLSVSYRLPWGNGSLPTLPVLLRPLLRLVRDYQLTSLADLLAFRYRSQLAGVLVTLFMLLGSLPYIALQIRAVTSSVQVLTHEELPGYPALVFCGMLILFSILFGARHISPREKHRGLVAAIAFESLIKVIALVAVGLFAIFGTFSGPAGLNQWLTEHPEATQALYQPVREGPWVTLLFLSFCAAFLLPRQFHMIFTENISLRSLTTAGWAFPLFLLLLNLAIPPFYGRATTCNSRWMQTTMSSASPCRTAHRGCRCSLYRRRICGQCNGNRIDTGALFDVPQSSTATCQLSRSQGRYLQLAAMGPSPVDCLIIAAGFGFYQLLEHNQGWYSWVLSHSLPLPNSYRGS